jgi:hypothetical protein
MGIPGEGGREGNNLLAAFASAGEPTARLTRASELVQRVRTQNMNERQVFSVSMRSCCRRNFASCVCRSNPVRPCSREQERAQRFAVKAALIGGLGGLIFGYDIGVCATPKEDSDALVPQGLIVVDLAIPQIIAGVLPDLQQHFALSTRQEEAIVSLMLAGAVVGGSNIILTDSRVV